jgi:hypothetical protein
VAGVGGTAAGKLLQLTGVVWCRGCKEMTCRQWGRGKLFDKSSDTRFWLVGSCGDLQSFDTCVPTCLKLPAGV